MPWVGVVSPALEETLLGPLSTSAVWRRNTRRDRSQGDGHKAVSRAVQSNPKGSAQTPKASAQRHGQRSEEYPGRLAQEWMRGYAWARPSGMVSVGVTHRTSTPRRLSSRTAAAARSKSWSSFARSSRANQTVAQSSGTVCFFCTTGIPFTCSASVGHSKDQGVCRRVGTGLSHAERGHSLQNHRFRRNSVAARLSPVARRKVSFYVVFRL
jgi:hypothetical protein